MSTKSTSCRIDERTPSRPELRGAQVYVQETKTLVYALNYPDGLRYVTSDGTVLMKTEADGRYIITASPSRRTRFSLARAQAFGRGEARVDPVALFKELAAIFRDHVYWPSPHTPELLALWVMATYQFQLFTYFPYLALSSASKRCGKSLAQEILAEVAFNATSPSVGATPATLFRDINANDCTVMLDEVETLGDGDKGNRSQMVAVLCGGFKQGASVPRCEPQEGGRYTTPTEYAVYSPKVFAGINEVADVIRDRSIGIRMVRRPETVECRRFSAATLGTTLQRLRDDLHEFGLTCIARVADAYAASDSLPLPRMDDRGRDIFEPLAAVARVVGPEAEAALFAAAEEIATERRADDASTEGDLDAAREALLAKIKKEREAAIVGGQPERDYLVLRSAEALALFKDAGMNGMAGEADAQSLLRRLGIKSAIHRDRGRVVRGYRIERDRLVNPDEHRGSGEPSPA